MPFLIEKMRKNAVFEHFIPCKLRKEPVYRKILRLFASKFYKSDRLLGIIFFIRPYHHNVLKRMIKTPKLYFYDTGLVVFLTKWDSPQTLMNGAMNGAILENYCISEIMKGYENSGKEPSLYFYRDKDLREIDLILERDGTLEPIEIKKTASPAKGMLSSFTALEKPNLRRGTGAIFCLAEHLGAFDKDNLIVPAGLV